MSETGGFEARAGETRGQALSRLARFLEASGVEAAREDARLLLFDACGLTHAEFVLSPETPLGKAEAGLLAEHAARRAAREPVSRILATRGFWTLDLAVFPDVLDPRPDTESVAALALSLVSARRDEALRLLDLGSGSGALLCALLAELPQAFGVAVDLSPQALLATRTNLTRCGFSARAALLRGCWGGALSGAFDLIVGNPPYVRSGDIDELSPEVRLHDPRLALDGGVDGLSCIREIAADLPRLLAPGGVAVLEVGCGQAHETAALLAAAGLDDAGTRRDAGGRERAVAARRRL
ncbi:peptide chain release factor N(5)-glutamine methyltransferase [Methylocystis bryophila]|uniref:Release factor glutamine methyltransferase n=1 Tax=Methylocystis bryophila TaxID=655015 RepID=A0A1W6MUX7_9HYPH|nr:peptide chain release factor N(5)-glutamine methyltransferase [Methylocystis bryophila]ARN81403.1 protein-(glutamine-N5) methyltransferase, release factor-specific [Methylocystis bryophila]BDV37398.1 release factor glutamine methyltransferase [Methylocystis bryophila]